MTMIVHPKEDIRQDRRGNSNLAICASDDGKLWPFLRGPDITDKWLDEFSTVGLKVVTAYEGIDPAIAADDMDKVYAGRRELDREYLNHNGPS